jgi:arylesterase/paraoxonase
MLEDVVMLPRANVVYFDGNIFRVAADELNFANGVALSEGGNHLYVSSTTGRSVHAYERSPLSGNLKEIGELSIGSGLDNLDLDADGNLWVAGHPKLLGMQAARDDSSKVTPSEVFEVTLPGAVPAAAKRVYANGGNAISGASIAAVFGSHLFIGSPIDNKVLVCTLR